MFGKRKDNGNSNILTDNMVTRGADQLNQQAKQVGQDVQALGHEAEKVLRPLNRVMAFASGIVIGGLRGMSQWARRGAMIGAFVGVAAMIMTAGGAPFLGIALGTGGWTMHGLGLAIGGWAAGLVAGAVGGAIAGGLKGGPERLAYEERKAKYADELALEGARNPRGKVRRTSAINKEAYKDYREAHSDGQFDRFQQRFDLASEDTSYSFADRIASERSDHGISR